jgi:hypothetical protein
MHEALDSIPNTAKKKRKKERKKKIITKKNKVQSQTW